MIILDYFLKWENSSPNKVFLNEPNNNEWRSITWAEVGIQARKALASLQKMGFQQGDRIALLSANCAEWIICDLAIIMGGFVSVPIYANVDSNSLASILKDSGSKAIFIGKLNDSDWKSQSTVIPEEVETIAMKGYDRPELISWNNFIDDSTEPLIHSLDQEDICTIIYTSGTTGIPKGVVHTYGSIIRAVKKASEEVKLNRDGNRFISYLPLSHAAERGIVEFGCIFCGGTIYFVESIDSFAKNIQYAQPTHFFGVPRIWEKFQAAIHAKLKPNLLNALLSIPLLKQFLISRLKKSLGLNKAIVILSGAAPLAPELIVWFKNLDISIREAYGLSENFNVISINPESDNRIGTVGKILDGQEVHISPETKEILQKCDWLMKEYFNKPELTSETLAGGYLHTGDMGKISEDGYLTITGRVKDIFKTSKGEYISPYMMELPFTESVLVDQICVMGSTYSQPFALIVLSQSAKNMQRDKVILILTQIMKQVNEGLMPYHKLKKIIITQDPWSIQNGLLTPTLKLKRNMLSKKYEPLLRSAFELEEPVTWFN